MLKISKTFVQITFITITFILCIMQQFMLKYIYIIIHVIAFKVYMCTLYSIWNLKSIHYFIFKITLLSMYCCGLEQFCYSIILQKLINISKMRHASDLKIFLLVNNVASMWLSWHIDDFLKEYWAWGLLSFNCPCPRL